MNQRQKGMLIGCALGDALGAPYEFNRVKLSEYTSEFTHPLTIFRRFQGGKKVGAVGQITDDTEMMLALFSSLQDFEYQRENAIKSYLLWANSKCPFMGKNTRALFHGVTTIKGYEKRIAKGTESQSNGCLMRCCPLALVNKWREAVKIDVFLSNPNQVCLESVMAYIAAMRQLLKGKSKEQALEKALKEVTLEEVQNAITQGQKQEYRDVTEMKGWVLHGLYCAFYALFSKKKFHYKLDNIIKKGGDTDTNACIAGALIGAQYGLDKMLTNETTATNISILLEVDTKTEIPRPYEYSNLKLRDIL